MPPVEMESRQTSARFRSDPLAFLDQAFPDAGDVFRLPDGGVCVAEPEAARSVLANLDGLFRDHSDFYNTRRGWFGPRSVQVEMNHEARVLLRGFVAERAESLPAAVRRALAPESAWPDAGNRLIYRHLAPALVRPGSPGAEVLGRRLDQVVERAVLAGARERRSRAARLWLRLRVRRDLVRGIQARRSAGGPPGDILDVVARSAPDARADDLAEVFLSFLFAVAGSVGFTLGWSLYLLATEPATDADHGAVVREALRLWPIAWMLGRHPARPHEIGGHRVTPRDLVVVCPYLVHRHPRHWPQPNRFLPERWHGAVDQRAFLPFGWGPHTCAAASIVLQLVESVVRVVRTDFLSTVTSRASRPTVGAALAPPQYGLSLTPRLAVRRPKGGEHHGEDRPGREEGPVRPAGLS